VTNYFDIELNKQTQFAVCAGIFRVILEDCAANRQKNLDVDFYA